MKPNILDTLRSNEFQDLVVDLSETTIDTFLEDGIIKDIPILGALFKSKNLISTIQDRLFVKKLFKFLKQLENTTSEQRIIQINKIEQDEKYRISVGEKLMYLIDKCEDSEKAEILGILFKNFILSNINYDDLLRCTNSINSLSTIDLREFIKKDAFIETFIKSNANIYINSGLVNFKLQSNLKRTHRALNTEDVEVIYIPSVLGKLLKLILKEYYNQPESAKKF
ncbi:MAG: hypothetical protein ACO1OF_20670 [Adhaeribacter sp.]